jgi:uncharacterized membrane protein
MEDSKHITDKDIQQVIGNLLRSGVYISMSIVLLGSIIYLFNHGSEPVDYAEFDINRVSLKAISVILAEAKTLKGAAIIQFGLLMLVFTPIARVLMSAVSFLMEKDYLYVVICLIVLAIIAISIGGGFTH